MEDEIRWLEGCGAAVDAAPVPACEAGWQMRVLVEMAWRLVPPGSVPEAPAVRVALMMGVLDAAGRNDAVSAALAAEVAAAKAAVAAAEMPAKAISGPVVASSAPSAPNGGAGLPKVKSANIRRLRAKAASRFAR